MPRKKISVFNQIEERQKTPWGFRMKQEKRTQRVQLVMQPSLYRQAKAVAEALDISFSELTHAALECAVAEFIRDFGDVNDGATLKAVQSKLRELAQQANRKQWETIEAMFAGLDSEDDSED